MFATTTTPDTLPTRYWIALAEGWRALYEGRIDTAVEWVTELGGLADPEAVDTAALAEAVYAAGGGH